MICSRFEAILRKSVLISVTVLLISYQFLLTAVAQVVPQYQSGKIMVQFTADTQIVGKSSRTGLVDFDAKVSRYDVYSIERMYPFLDYVEPTPRTRKNLLALRRTYYVYYRADVTADIVAEDFSGASGVVYAEPVPVNRIYTPNAGKAVDPDDPRFGDQQELRQLRLPEAWDQIKSESGTPKVVIAIIDGGGEWRHEDLHANVWTNEDEIPSNGIDDDKNGFIDDVHGANFGNGDDANNDPTGRPGAIGRAHGTSVAGVANAVADNGIGIAGAAWNADLMHINASGAGSDDPTNGYEAILYAAANGADIINTSWGATLEEAGGPKIVIQTLDLATDMGSLIVASAGNDAGNFDVFPEYPARHPRVLSVGATEKTTRRRAFFSNYGRLVNVFAPGEKIVTTGVNNGYVEEEGTSFSSPLVAGVAALVKTRFPDMSPDSLREHIRLSSENIDAENPDYAGNLGRGLVNAEAAVQKLELPALRVKRWSWTDSGGDQMVDPGDIVQITALFVNYLADARQLKVKLINPEPYPFIDMNRSETDISFLAGGDSVEVDFEFTVAASAPPNQRIRFYTHVQDENHEDIADMISFRMNLSVEETHKNLSTFYTATGGDQWINNTNWDISRIPSEDELSKWHGVTLEDGWLTGLALNGNNLTQSIPSVIGKFIHLRQLDLSENALSGKIPSELGNPLHLNSIDLSGNVLSGQIPAELGNLSQLQSLLLHDNSLSGEIPAEIGNLSQVYLFDLSNNSLSGEIPSELGNLLQVGLFFSLNDNSLSGEIPSELGNFSRLRAMLLQNNSLSGEIPAEFGNLSQLQALLLNDNSLSGEIPAELGNLSELKSLLLQNNSLSGEVPSELGNLSQLEALVLENNSLSGSLPRSFMQLDNLGMLAFVGQNLCAPMDDEFQGWLKQVPEVRGPNCGALRLTGNVRDQSYARNQPISPLALPEAIEGVAPINYTLSPTLPEGLNFDPSTRTISGTPTKATSSPIQYTYKAIDAAGSSVSLQFSIEIRLPVSVEQGSLPVIFEVLGNYPNPFRQTTHLSFNLPWPAQIDVEILDLLGRRVLSRREHSEAGWERSIEVDGAPLSAGIYLYRLIAESPSGRSVKTGNFVRLR